MGAENKMTSLYLIVRNFFLNGALFLYKNFIEPKSDDEDLRRREFILNVLILCVILFFIAGFVFALYYTQIMNPYNGLPISIFCIIIFYFLTIHFFSRCKLYSISAILFLIFFLFLTIIVIYNCGVQSPTGIILFSLIIVMSGIIMSTFFAFIFAAVISFIIFLDYYCEVHHLITVAYPWSKQMYNESDIFLYAVIFFIIATVSWLSNREIEKSLKRARKSEMDLKQERDLLEIKVREKTEELQKTQVERMSQFYRFAEIGRLSSGLFHDLINPLTALSLNIKRIGKEKGDEHLYLQKSIMALRRVEEHISNVRNQIRGHDSKNFFSAKREVHQAVWALEYKAKKFDVKIIINRADDVQIFGSSIKFNQIAINLLSNAIDASLASKKREVLVSLILDNDIIRLCVEDFGCGIPEENHDKIFEPFFTTKESSGGIGIGLSMIKNIVEKDFLGKIFFVSRVGAGSKFFVNLKTHNTKSKIIKTTMDNQYKSIIEKSGEEVEFLDSAKSRSIFYAALRLSCLAGIPEYSDIAQKASDFILSHKNDDWIFSTSSTANFCALFALMEYDPEIIDGSALAKILAMLASIEEKEGGPYYAYIGEKERRRTWLVANAAIGIFLAFNKASLPSLDSLINLAAEEQNFGSNTIELQILTAYLMSKFYEKRLSKDSEIEKSRQKMINYILARKRDNNWENILNASMAVSSLLMLGFEKEKLSNEINYLKNSVDKLSSNYPFCVDKYGNSFNSTQGLNAAFYLEAINRYENYGILFSADNSINSYEKNIIAKIMETADKRLEQLPIEFKDLAIQVIKDTIKRNDDKQMYLMAHYVKTALGRKADILSEEFIAELGLMNTFFWTAFIIYDDFWDQDESADPKTLPIANFFARNYVDFFCSILPDESGFKKFFNQLMDNLDAANTWENTHCHTKVQNNTFAVPESLPDYGNYEMKYQPASGHILGPVAMFMKLGYSLDSLEVQNLIAYFRNYLIAMQINDDAHDWLEDMQRGRLSTVVVMMLHDWKEKYPDRKEIDLQKDLPELQQLFWYKTMIRACQTAIDYSKKSREFLNNVGIFEDTALLRRYCHITENVGQKGIHEHKKSIDLLKVFGTKL